MQIPPGKANPPDPRERWQLARRLFEAACRRSSEEREAFLEEACAGASRLREDVERLLRLDCATGLDLEPPSAERMAQALGGVPELERPGQHIGAYVLERRLGTGGMGSVWLAARGDRQFEKRVALKVVRRGMDSEDILRRFAIERQLLADLEHPGVTRLLDGGLTADGRPYLVMEHVDGEPIDRWCDSRRAPVQERVELFRRVCETVDYAHRRRIVHRDIKPGNVLVTAEGEPKLLDFGIAKILDPDRAVDLTLAEHLPLTPGYASPEQVQGQKITPASDVYTLGVMLYELLTGRRPYPCDTTSRADLERAICEREPPRPSTTVAAPLTPQDLPRGEEGPTPDELCARRATDSRRLRAQLQGDLDNIVLKALDKEPERRYAGAGELSADLGRMLHGLPVLARPASWGYRARKFVRRNRTLAVSVAIVFLALSAGLVTSLRFWASERSQREETEAREYATRIAAAGLALRAHDVVDARRHLEAAPERLRGWEWRHFMGRTDRSERTFAPEAGPLLDCAISPDGVLLATGGDGREVAVLQLSTGKELARWGQHPRSVRTLEFSADGNYLLAARLFSSVAIWSLTERREVQVWGDLPRGANVATYDHSSTRVAAGGQEGTILVWKVDSGEELARLEGHEGVVNGLAFHPDGELLVSVSTDGTARLWDLSNGGTSRLVLAGHDRSSQGILSDVAFLPRGSHFLTAGFNGELALWDGTDQDPSLQVTAHGKNIWELAVDPAGQRVATASADGSVGLWEPTSGRRLGLLLGHADIVPGVAFHPELPLLVSCSKDRTVKLWRRRADDVLRLSGFPGWNSGLAASKDGSLLAESGEGGIRLLDRAGEPVWECPTASPVSAVAFQRRSDRLAAGTSGGQVLLLQTGSSTPVLSFDCGFNLSDLEVSPDGRFLVACGEAGGMGVWSAEDGSEVHLPAVEGHHSRDIDVAPDGRQLLWGEGDGTIHLLDLESGAERVLVQAPSTVWGVAFDSSGERCAAACKDGTVRIWSTARPAEATISSGHSGEVFCVDFSPGGERVASGGQDSTVRLWDARTGRELAVLYGHEERVDEVLFSADGGLLVSKSVDGEVRFWDAAPELASDTR